MIRNILLGLVVGVAFVGAIFVMKALTVYIIWLILQNL